MNASKANENINLRLSEREYHIIMASLRELVAEMHLKDFPIRVGASREVVSDLAQEFYDEATRLDIGE